MIASALPARLGRPGTPLCTLAFSRTRVRLGQLLPSTTFNNQTPPAFPLGKALSLLLEAQLSGRLQTLCNSVASRHSTTGHVWFPLTSRVTTALVTSKLERALKEAAAEGTGLLALCRDGKQIFMVETKKPTLGIPHFEVLFNPQRAGKAAGGKFRLLLLAQGAEPLLSHTAGCFMRRHNQVPSDRPG